ncbi:MAG: FAD-dependent oxidoreductase [Anaeromyxobacter sp.]
MSPDAIIVGAGIVGAACADALARAGLRVLVLEAGFPAGGTTAAAMGHVVVMDDGPAQLALTRRSRDLWAALAPELPPGAEDAACGTLWVAYDDEELRLVAPRAEAYRAAGVTAELLDARGLSEAEPSLRPGLAGGMLVPGDRVLYPPAAARFLLARAAALGAEVRSGVEVQGLGPRRVRTPAGWIDAGAVVLATGLAAARLVPDLPLRPRKGHLVVTGRVPGMVRHQLVELGYLKSAHGGGAESVAFNVQPRATGQLLVGSSREFVGLDASLNAALRARMLRRAMDFLPGLAGVPALRTWCGFRPCTPDNLPLVGWYPAIDGLLVAAGHEGLGITTAPGTGELVAELVLGRPPTLDAAAYSPVRASLRAHGAAHA